jgi:hypothetical protein
MTFGNDPGQVSQSAQYRSVLHRTQVQHTIVVDRLRPAAQSIGLALQIENHH